MHRAQAARPRGFDSLPSLSDVRTLILFFEIKLLRARGSDPESISRNVKTRFQMFINFRNVVILLVILYILIFILVFVTHVHTTHSHPMHANTETVRTSSSRGRTAFGKKEPPPTISCATYTAVVQRRQLLHFYLPMQCH